MTVCIAAACEQGKVVVTASDGLLSYGGVTADVLPGKSYWFGDWQFLYAGTPSEVDLIFEELRKIDGEEPTALHRANIQDTVRRAYDRFVAGESSRGILAPYGLSLDEFKQTGLRAFGKQKYSELCSAIEFQARSIANELIVIGWGDKPSACMLFSVSTNRSDSYALAPLCAIGSGGYVALSTLLSLGQARHVTLTDTIYTVAAAKFSSEMSEGQFVGENTLIHISWKRRAEDDPNREAGVFLQREEIRQLRSIWEQFGRPKIPHQVNELTTQIASKHGLISPAVLVQRVQTALSASSHQGNSHDE